MAKKKKNNNNKKIVIIIGAVLLFLLISIPVGFTIIYHIASTPKPLESENLISLVKNETEEEPKFKNHLTTSYDELDDFIKEKNIIKKEDYDKNNYYVFLISYDPDNEYDVTVTDYKITGSNIVVHVSYKGKCGLTAPQYNNEYYAIKVAKGKTINNLEVISKRTNNPDCGNVEYKPIIYIYPKEEMEVTVTLGNSDYLTTSYPKYDKSWKVLASPNGNLKINNRNYYGLYWEGKNHNSYETDYGFVIKGEDTSKFLEDKLSILGLNEREINEFIIYWLPKMEHNKYNYIRFETKEEIDSYMPISIDPAPDTLIRVYMQYKTLDDYKKVKEQQLDKITRKGYSVIEWGGSEIK